MNVKDYLNNDLIAFENSSISKAEMLKKIAALAKKSGITTDLTENEILEKFNEREKLSSTAIGNNLAIPHFRSKKVKNFALGIYLSPSGIDFDAIDEKKVNLFVFLIAPEAKRNEHIRLLANISKALSNPSAIQTIVKSKNTTEAYQNFLSMFNTFETNLAPQKFAQFNIVVQSEEIFEDVLNTLTDTDDCFVSVLEASSASKYLYRMPLFANFWTQENEDYNRVFVVQIKNSLANELMRKLNMLISSKYAKGLLFSVTELVWLNGNIDL